MLWLALRTIAIPLVLGGIYLATVATIQNDTSEHSGVQTSIIAQVHPPKLVSPPARIPDPTATPVAVPPPSGPLLPEPIFTPAPTPEPVAVVAAAASGKRENLAAVSPHSLTEEEIRAILLEAGWAKNDIEDALCVSWKESWWTVKAHRVKDGLYDSLGLFQINLWWADKSRFMNPKFPEFDASQAFEPVYNAWYALRIFREYGWEEWWNAARACGLLD